MKEFKLHFRWRTSFNELHDTTETIRARSQKEAKQAGKELERARAHAYSGKFWFIGIVT